MPSKNIPDTVKDVLLDNIADNANILHVCSGEPANYAGIAAVTLGNDAMVVGDGNGDYTIGDGDVSGRKLTVTQRTVTPTGTGTVNHVVLADTAAEVLKAVTTCSNFDVSVGVDFTLAAYDACEVSDAT